METRLGLTPEEMISIFNRMYLDVWNRMRDHIQWEASNISRQLAEGQEVDIRPLLLQVLEVVVTAVRDGTILALYENNDRIYEELRKAGVNLPEPEPLPPLD
ncbi:MAG TPA: hypothetical protein VNO81_06235 [Candidatus Nitrosotenuis sp.]|jgi:CII-binding regulator of phage lambda lysogenization HflD|nr:hypothetical protein [Candidatus Nitrosotenuis sp.]